ncbi:DUF6612 family protein [Paenibacillus arenosi]|uniref:Lipoprotein n=1 Tax=Paenibacillus arenosi TaxID=2774142 RepID=A0ABR9B2H0_9BACL|nr:DUF6612 family protein [Paenibacillus arenosi]MBD8500502.1 hypothetical protein [Paenibacillus arenosi]
MNKKWMKSTLVLLFAMTLVIAGCGQKESPAAASKTAMQKMTEMKSYGFETTVKVNDLQFPPSLLQSDPSTGMVVQMLKNASLSVSGKMQNEPVQAEMDLDVKLEGDMAFSFKLPIMMNSEKMYMKVPSLPIPGFPADLAGKFIEMDMKELAKEAGQDILPTAKDIELMNKFYNDVYTSFVAKFDEKTFFSDVNVKDAKLPEDIKAKQVVKFSITNENVDQAANTLVKDALPALLDVVAKDEYKKLLGGELTAAQVEEAKKELKALTDGDLKKGLDEMKKVLKINDVSFTTAIDKDGYPVYTAFVINVDLTNEGETMKIGAQIDTKLKDINKKQEFKPAPTDTITMQELEAGNF